MTHINAKTAIACDFFALSKTFSDYIRPCKARQPYIREFGIGEIMSMQNSSLYIHPTDAPDQPTKKRKQCFMRIIHALFSRDSHSIPNSRQTFKILPKLLLDVQNRLDMLHRQFCPICNSQSLSRSNGVFNLPR
jgi:hypothetical protein